MDCSQKYPKARDRVQKEDAEDAEDNETLLGHVQFHLSLHVLLQHVLLLECLCEFQKFEQFYETAYPRNLHKREDLGPSTDRLKEAQEPWKNCHKVYPEPAFEVGFGYQAPGCKVLIRCIVKDACIEAYNDLNDEHHVNN